jgi:hypothetical protein
MRVATIGVGRGVYVAPWMGPDDELVLIAITAAGKLAAPPLTIPHGASRLAASDELWAAVERVDPDPKTYLRAV